MAARRGIELWGGLECTVARIGDRFRDQVVETGHRDRPDDLDRIAALGIRTLRYPVVAETISPERPDRHDWGWHDERLGRMRELGIRPIAGLIHHGSGPAYTNLLDPAFPRLLARHAERAARRYPFIDLYTPVNEPLTTARFAALYGHWYPHERNYATFLRALVNQCRGVLLSMRAVRRINPAARLVQTEDLGRTFATPPLAYQAEHENERRWLTFDLLAGRVDRHHPWWRILRDHGVAARELAAFLGGEGTPDIVGINHYLTSERFLDQRLSRYPEHLWGGNGRDRYADVEAVRVDLPGAALGPAARLREVWERYRLPIAVTEVHHGCTRDEQLRWMSDVWDAAKTVRQEGADIRAVTVWSLFGAVDWNNLLTRETGIYEPGAFDARGPAPRPTALAAAAASLASTGRFDHPVLDRPGWWRRDTRFYRPLKRPGAFVPPGSPRALLVIGEPGPLVGAVSRLASSRGLDHTLCEDEAAAASTLEGGRFWAVVDLGRPSARTGIASLARRCAENRLPYLSISAAPLFDGSLGRPATENDRPGTGTAPHRGTAAHEAGLLAAHPSALVVRAGPLFGPWDPDSFAFRMLAALHAGAPIPHAGGDRVSPSYLPDLVHVALDLLVDGETGIWHLTNGGAVSGTELAAALAERAGLPPPEAASAAGGRDLALATERGALMPPLPSALDRFLAECEPDWRLPADFHRVAAE